jgi:hypothetical protein
LAIKQTIYPHTGIFQRKVSQVELRMDEESLKDLAELTASGSSEDPLGVNRIESEVTGVLNDYIETDMGGLNEVVRRDVASAGLDYVVQRYIDRVRDDLTAEFKRRLSEEEKRKLIRKFARLERAADACEILSSIPGVRLRISRAEQTSINALADGFMLGREYERFRVRSSEGKAFTGNKTLSGASAGGIAAKENAHRRYQKIVAAFVNTGLSQRKFSHRFSIPLSTLKRALKKVRPNPSK